MSRCEILKRYCRPIKVFDDFILYNNGEQIEVWLDFKDIGVVVEKGNNIDIEVKSGEFDVDAVKRKVNEIIIEIMSEW